MNYFINKEPHFQSRNNKIKQGTRNKQILHNLENKVVRKIKFDNFNNALVQFKRLKHLLGLDYVHNNKI